MLPSMLSAPSSSRHLFEYLDETSIPPELTCSICREVCTNPHVTACDHLFCQACITRTIGTLTGSCPNCRTRLSIRLIKPANSLISQMIDQLAIRCMKCGRKDLKRNQIEHHIRSECPESIISCTSSAESCAWKGPVSQLDIHMQHCMARKLAPMMRSIADENRSMKRSFVDMESSYAQQENISSTALRNHQERLNTMKDIRRSDLQSIERNRERLEHDKNNRIHQVEEMLQQVKGMTMSCVQYQLSMSYFKQKFKKQKILMDNLLDQGQMLEDLLSCDRYTTLANYLTQQSTRSEIDLSVRYLIDHDMNVVVERIVEDKRCKALNLCQNHLTEQGISILVTIWQTYSQLEVMLLSFNAIGDMGVQHLVSILSVANCNLVKLDLDSNGITDVGAQSLANALKTNQTLQYLSLGKNQIQDHGIESLATAIKTSNRTIKELHLNDNPFTRTQTVLAFISMMQTHPSLTVLNLTNCNISDMNRFSLHQASKYKTNFVLFT